jgi:septal ring factor EnvC (AmiA/AmiB activator)
VLAQRAALDGPPAGGALGEHRAQIERLERERRQAERQLATIQASEGELRSEIAQLAERVRESHQRKEALEERIAQQQALAERQRREAQRLEAEVRAGERRIGQRLRRLYRLAKQGRTGLLFQMARFRTFAKDSRTVALLQDGDRAAIAQFQALARELAAQREQLARSMGRLLALRTELEEESRQLTERESYLRAAMGDVSRNRTLYRQYLDEVEQMRVRMASAVARLEAEAETRAKAAPPPTRPRSPAELRGTLPPPAQGRVIAAFGAQDPRYELKKRQRGIVLRVAPKAAVAAVAAGRAVHAGPFRGYQALVVLDHGEGLFTVYGHLEGLRVQRGDWVPAGAEVGSATYQPVDEAYDVYFEVRHNGKPDDPLQWLQPGRLPVDPQAAQATQAGS